MPILFRPIKAIEKPLDDPKQLSRLVDRLESPFGKFSVRAVRPEPGGERSVNLVMDTVQALNFLSFLDDIKGRWKTFWLPTLQEDLVLVEDIDAADDEIEIHFTNYTDYEFPSEHRRHLAFMFGDGSFIYRRVTASETDGTTETLTLNAALGQNYPITRNSMVCFLENCRLLEDKVIVQWEDDDLVLCQIPVKEVLGVPLGGGDTGGPTGDDLPQPCTEETVFEETWEYGSVDDFLDAWPAVVVQNLCGGPDVDGGELVLTLNQCGGIFNAALIHRTTLSVDNGDYLVSGTMEVDVDTGQPFGLSANNEDFNGSTNITVTDGIIEIDIELHILFTGGPVVHVFTISPITVQRVCG